MWLQCVIFPSTYMLGACGAIWRLQECEAFSETFTFAGPLLQVRDFEHAFSYGWPKKIQVFLAFSI